MYGQGISREGTLIDIGTNMEIIKNPALGIPIMGNAWVKVKKQQNNTYSTILK